MQRLKFLDLFSGIGGFRLGMEHAGNRCVGWCDIDKYARKSYEAMYPHSKKEWHTGDIRKVSNADWEQLAKKNHGIDVICGGFPCQTFSIAGRRKGFLDKTRGTLFFQIARAAKVIKPAYLFMENVKGLLSHNHGRTFGVILATLDEIGYDAEWHLFNSKYFGVPQNRERIYIIAHRRGAKTASVFSHLTNPRSSHQRLSYYYNARKHGNYGTNDIIKPNRVSKALRANRQDNTVAYVHHGKHQSKNIYGVRGVSPTVDATTYKHKIMVAKKTNNIKLLHQSRRELCRIYSQKGISPTISTMQGGDRQPKIGVPIKDSKLSYYHNTSKFDYRIYNDNGIMRSLSATDYKHIPNVRRIYNARKHHKYSVYDVYSRKGVSPTLQTMQGGDRQPKVAIPCLTPDRVHKRQNGRRFKDNEDPEFTLNTIDRNGVGLMNHGKLVVRKLTPLECWRLQGYPDCLFKRAKQVCSNSQLYKQAGNSVTVSVIEYIARRLEVGDPHD